VGTKALEHVKKLIFYSDAFMKIRTIKAY